MKFPRLRCRLPHSLSQVGRSSTFWSGLAVIFSYWVWAPLIADKDALTEWERAFLISFAATAVVAYTPGVIKFLTTPYPVQAQQLTMGIVVAWFGTAAGGLYLLAWRLAGQPAWMVNNYVNGWWIWLQIVGGALHISAPRSIENEIPRPNWARMWLALLAGLILGFGAAVLKPDVADVMNRLKPYISDTVPGDSSHG